MYPLKNLLPNSHFSVCSGAIYLIQSTVGVEKYLPSLVKVNLYLWICNEFSFPLPNPVVRYSGITFEAYEIRTISGRWPPVFCGTVWQFDELFFLRGEDSLSDCQWVRNLYVSLSKVDNIHNFFFLMQ